MKSPTRKITIVVPVYGDWPSLAHCIASLKEHTPTQHTIMLVNDCGPDADMIETEIIKAIKDSENFLYFRNPSNLGFVGTCNRASLELDDTDNDILLLNSDTVVTQGWIQEMRDVLYSNDKIATVSPRSNNATIATIPLASIQQHGIDAQDSYRLFIKIKDDMPRYSIVPVAHGFCMLIRRSVIKQLGLFDPIFGKGYGEETDFCLRLNQAGYINTLSNHSYVHHLEAKSFSMSTKQKLLEQNSKIIWKRYPYYKKAVSHYLKQGSDIVDRLAHTAISTKVPALLLDIRGVGNNVTPTQITQWLDEHNIMADGKSVVITILRSNSQQISLQKESTITVITIDELDARYDLAVRIGKDLSLKEFFDLCPFIPRIITELSVDESILATKNATSLYRLRSTISVVSRLSDNILVDTASREVLEIFDTSYKQSPVNNIGSQSLTEYFARPVNFLLVRQRWQAQQQALQLTPLVARESTTPSFKSRIGDIPVLGRRLKSLRRLLK